MQIETMTMISDLPRDLVEEILSRVPLKFMRAVRLTCKKWNTLSKNRSFSKTQIDKEEASTKESEYQMILMMNRKLYLMSVVNEEDLYTELKGKLTCLTEQHLKVKHFFNSEGLLFCILRDDNKNTKLMVWNPYCLQPKWFEPRCSYRRLNYLCYYGFGYVENIKNKSCVRSHKVLRFIEASYFVKKQFSWYEIYDIESDSWRTLDVTPLWSITFDNAVEYHIISFDFIKERFGPVMVMPHNAEVYDDVILSCVGEKKLAALLYLQDGSPDPNDFEIWITTEIEADDKLSWSKFMTLNFGPEIPCNLESFIMQSWSKLTRKRNSSLVLITKLKSLESLEN